MSAPFLLEQSEVKPNLHAAIMNLPCKFEAAWQTPAPSDWVEGYVNGHRDTRHAAAELANEHDAIKQELLEALRELHEAESARFPPAEAGQDAQTAWATRIDVAHALAAAAIRKATLGSAS